MTLDDLFSISKGKKPPALFDEPLEAAIPFIKIDGIRNAGQHQYCEDSADLVTCKKNDVLMVWDGAYCGLVGFDLEGAIGSTIARLRPKSGEVFGPYVGRLLQSKFEEIQKNATGAAIPHVNGGHLRRLEISLPPFAEQKRIAAMLDKADSLRHQRKESIQLTEKLLQSVFIEMFGDPRTNPKGLPMRELRKLGIIQTGNTPPRSNKANYAAVGLEWIKTDNIVEDQVTVTPAIERLSGAGAKVARVAPAGSLLVACIAGSEKSIGRAALTDRKVAFNQQINSITPHADTSPIFLYFLIKIARRQIQMAAAKGMKKMINKSTFEGLRFISPDYDDQLRFERVAQRLIEQCNDCQEQLLHLEGFFSSLQQRAFRGDLDLSRLLLVNDIEAFEQEADKLHQLIHVTLPKVPDLKYKKQAFIASSEIELILKAQDKRVVNGEPLAWSEDYFQYRILGRDLEAPYCFMKIWETVEQRMPEADYDVVKEKIFSYIADGKLRQRFDKKQKALVLFPRRA